MGAWIEIGENRILHRTILSLPTWERGLKSHSYNGGAYTYYVAPYMGAWIEMYFRHLSLVGSWSRSLHGSVD